MSDTNQKIDEEKGDNVLAKMLKTSPKPKYPRDQETNEKSFSRKRDSKSPKD